MRKILFISALTLTSWVNSQTNLLFFDGTDVVTLGPSVGNGIRTVECWFRLDSQIDATINDYVTILSRDDDQFNVNEFNLAFQKSTVINSGTLRFSIALNSGNERNVYSNANLWLPEKWYHVAVCIDAVNGMSMFIDGVKQASTHPYTASPATSTVNTVVGNWGTLNRYFIGSIEDVHFASQPLYSTDFIPPCPNRSIENSTIGLYHFNEGTGIVTADASGNQFNATINGATWSTDFICSGVSINEIDKLINMDIYPNPANGDLNIQAEELQIEEVLIKDLNGKILIKQSVNNSSASVDLSILSTGSYYVEVSTIDGVFHSRVIKL